MIISVVPMKGNNERLPGKNIKPLCEKPLFYYLLNTLSKVSDQIVVDTDDNNISQLVASYFPKILISSRPEKYRDPLIGGNQLLERFISNREDIYIQSHVTSPLLSKESLLKGIKLTELHGSAFSVTKIQQALWFEGNPLNHNPNGSTIRTQDMKPIFVENGAFFIFKGSFYLENKVRNNEKSKMVELNFPETIDIDTLQDFKLAELYLKSGVKTPLGAGQLT